MTIPTWAAVSVKHHVQRDRVMIHIHAQGPSVPAKTQWLIIPQDDPDLATDEARFKLGITKLLGMFSGITGLHHIRLTGAGATAFISTHGPFIPGTRIEMRALNKNFYHKMVKPSITDPDHRKAFFPSHLPITDGASGATTLDTTPIPAPTQKQLDRAQSIPHAWGAVSVKRHLIRGCHVIHVQAQIGDRRKQKRILVGTQQISDNVRGMYQHGLKVLREITGGKRLEAVYVAGINPASVIKRNGSSIQELDLLTYHTVIDPTIPSPARRFAFDPTTDLYCDPVRAQRKRTLVHIHSDASQVVSGAVDPGYGHGTVTRNLTDVTTTVTSTWNPTPVPYNSNQYELDGMITAVDRVIHEHGLRPGTADQLVVIIHCDNTGSVDALKTIVTGTKAQRHETLTKVFGAHAQQHKRDWMGQHNLIIEPHWVKGHNGELYNETADRMASSARILHYRKCDYDLYLYNIHQHAAGINAEVAAMEDEPAPEAEASFVSAEAA